MEINLSRRAILIFLSVMLVVLCYLGLLVAFSWPISELSINKAALLGDSFGIINSLFSGLAFAGLILTVLLQRAELSESREIFKAQKFEDAFYRLIDFYNRNLKEISIDDNSSDSPYKGVGGLIYLLKKFKSATVKYNILLNDDIPEDAYRLYVFEEIQRNLKSQSRYLGTIESILFLIDNEIEKPAESAYYIKILASQLTVHEVKYIFYQCLISSSETPLVKLINKLKLLDERLTEADINESIIKHYNEIHGTDFLIDAKAPSFMPFTKAEIKEFKSKYNKLIKKD